MKPIILGLSLTLLLIMLVSTARAEHYEVYLLAGQSNMDGRGAKKDLVGKLTKWAKPQKDVLIRFSAGGLHRKVMVNSGFLPLEPGYSGSLNNKSGTLPTDTFGPEVSFGRTLADGQPGKHIALIKFCEGGTSLQKDWDPNDKEKLYAKFIEFVKSSLKELKDRDDTYEIRGMIWHQGESDTSLKTEEYQTLLTDLIKKVRADLVVKDIPFVVGEVYDNRKRDMVRAAQKATAKEVPRVYFISAQNLKTLDSGTHFDAASQIELGKRFSEPLLKLPAGKKKLNKKPVSPSFGASGPFSS